MKVRKVLEVGSRKTSWKVEIKLDFLGFEIWFVMTGLNLMTPDMTWPSDECDQKNKKMGKYVPDSLTLFAHRIRNQTFY